MTSQKKTGAKPLAAWRSHFGLAMSVIIFTGMALVLASMILVAIVGGTRWYRDLSVPANHVPEKAGAASAGKDAPAKENQSGTDDKDRITSEIQALDKRADQEQSLLDKRADEEERLIDKLAALTAVFTVLLAAGAWTALSQEKERSRQKIAEMVEDTSDKLKVQAEWIRSNLPFLAGVNNRVDGVVGLIETKLPSEWNWSLSEVYADLTPEDRQIVLVSELKIAFLDFFDLNAAPQMRHRLSNIYLALARFYLGRSEYEPGSHSRKMEDRGRVGIYLENVRQLAEPFSSAVSWRLHSVMLMLDFKAEKARTDRAPDRRLLDSLLTEIKADLRQGHELCEDEAGAYYNLSFVLGELEGKLLQSDGQESEYRKRLLDAIAELEKLTARQETISPIQRAKFLPDACINLACFHVLYASSLRTEGGSSRSTEKSYEKRALEACRLGKTLAAQNHVMEKFIENLKDEMDGDLRTLAVFYPQAMDEIHDPNR